ncbi:hypothetical protein BX666DRAFT_2028628 [Dichotomocladium elegans]|nr:hypothetical protein BX666DRAFT_2028628 [Dichotomocladium elegans]
MLRSVARAALLALLRSAARFGSAYCCCCRTYFTPTTSEVPSILEQHIFDATSEADLHENDRVLSIADRIACAYGLKNCQAEMLGMALNLEADSIGIVDFGNDCLIKVDDIVKRTGAPDGQHVLIIGDLKTGKTVVALDTILNQKHWNSGSDESTAFTSLSARMLYTIALQPPPPRPLSFSILAPFSGAAVFGGCFRDNGKHFLIIHNVLSKQVVPYRHMYHLLHRPLVREAYAGGILYFPFRLLERTAKMNKSFDYDSMTALPIMQAVPAGKRSDRIV